MARSFTAQDVRRGLAAVGLHKGNLARASRETGVARSTLRQWRDGKFPKAFNAEEVTPTEQEILDMVTQRAAMFRDVGTLYLQHLREPQIIAGAKAKDSALVAAIMEDKARKIEGLDQIGGGGGAVNVKVAFVTPDALRQMSAGIIEGRDVRAIEVDVPALPALPEPKRPKKADLPEILLGASD